MLWVSRPLGRSPLLRPDPQDWFFLEGCVQGSRCLCQVGGEGCCPSYHSVTQQGVRIETISDGFSVPSLQHLEVDKAPPLSALTLMDCPSGVPGPWYVGLAHTCQPIIQTPRLPAFLIAWRTTAGGGGGALTVSTFGTP